MVRTRSLLPSPPPLPSLLSTAPDGPTALPPDGRTPPTRRLPPPPFHPPLQLGAMDSPELTSPPPFPPLPTPLRQRRRRSLRSCSCYASAPPHLTLASTTM
ncbi:hypothetical protein HPB47_007227 [Ixodes persulcatus]|uniref:Uncharacterized protein n=1 Tax=Ixodes persulcatus TaxID=34615 RepID=A0AC60P8E2_IXOPE|nr:hypothetical protein HPB47_007227 [Ixodes persulcatus]